MNRMRESIKTGRKLTWNEQFIWVPLARMAAKILVILVVFGSLFLILLGIIKLIKFLWYV
jgi:hypothetical protein